METNKNNNSEVTLPIAFASALYVVVITDTASNGYPLSYGVYQLSSKSFYAYARRIVTGDIERECKIVCVNRYCMNLLYAPYWGKQR